MDLEGDGLIERPRLTLANRVALWSAMLACAAIVALLVPAQAPAPVPPKNCGNMEVNGKTYNIKADQIRCAKARRYARRYLESHNRPSGYQCQDYGRETQIKFRCWSGNKEFFAIRR